jgi:hypothetical protein
MKKLLISNLCTFILTAGVSFFVYSSSLEKEAESIAYQYKVKEIKKNASQQLDRQPSSINKEAFRVAETRAQMAKLKKELKYNPDDWNDQFLMHYQGTKEVNGELVSLADLYRPYFTELHSLIKKYHGDSSAKRLARLLAAREKYDKHTRKLEEESFLTDEIESEKRHILVEKEGKKMQEELEESGDYTKEEIERFVSKYKDRQHSVAENKLAEEHMAKLEKFDQLYEFEKKKILGPAYLEAERLKEHYNDQYQKAYGNEFYQIRGEWDDQANEYVHYDEPIEKESKLAIFRIKI